MRTLAARLWGAATLDSQTYREIKNDPRATWQGLGFLMTMAVSHAVQASFHRAFTFDSDAWDVVFGWVGWLLGTGWYYVVGTKIIGSARIPSFVQLFRVFAFSLAPGIPVTVASFFLPAASVPSWMELGIVAGMGIWGFVADLVSLRVAFEYDSLWDAVWLVVLSVLLVVVPIGLLAVVIVIL